MPNFETTDFRAQPAYGLAEAARYLRLPAATLRSWVVGRPYLAVSESDRRSPHEPAHSLASAASAGAFLLEPDRSARAEVAAHGPWCLRPAPAQGYFLCPERIVGRSPVAESGVENRGRPPASRTLWRAHGPFSVRAACDAQDARSTPRTGRVGSVALPPPSVDR